MKQENDTVTYMQQNNDVSDRCSRWMMLVTDAELLQADDVNDNCSKWMMLMTDAART